MDKLLLENYIEFRKSINISEAIKNQSGLNVIETVQSTPWSNILANLNIDVLGQNNPKKNRIVIMDEHTKITFEYAIVQDILIVRIEESYDDKRLIAYVTERGSFSDMSGPHYLLVNVEKVSGVNNVSADTSRKQQKKNKDTESVYATLDNDDGVLTMHAEGYSYTFASRKGQPEEILKEVASKDNIGTTYDRKKLKEENIVVSRSLNKVFKSSIFKKELAPFATIDTDAIKIQKNAYLTKDELNKIKKKAVRIQKQNGSRR